MGYGRNVVVLTRDAAYRKSPELTALARLVYRKYPTFVRAMEMRHTMYNQQVAQVEALEKAGEVFVIRPGAPLEIGRLENDPEKVQQVYDRGRADAQTALRPLKEWLRKV